MAIGKSDTLVQVRAWQLLVLPGLRRPFAFVIERQTSFGYIGRGRRVLGSGQRQLMIGDAEVLPHVVVAMDSTSSRSLRP